MPKEPAKLDYEKLRQRIDKRCKQLSVVSIDGLDDKRLAEIRKDAHGISTLELTYLHQWLHCSNAYLVFGRDRHEEATQRPPSYDEATQGASPGSEGQS